MKSILSDVLTPFSLAMIIIIPGALFLYSRPSTDLRAEKAPVTNVITQGGASLLCKDSSGGDFVTSSEPYIFETYVTEQSHDELISLVRSALDENGYVGENLTDQRLSRTARFFSDEERDPDVEYAETFTVVHGYNRDREVTIAANVSTGRLEKQYCYTSSVDPKLNSAATVVELRVQK